MKFWLYLLFPLSLFALHYEQRGSVHILTIEPQNHIFRIGLSQNNGLGVEPTSSMAKRTGAIAAINGGFFEDQVGAYIGASAGSLKINGTYYSTCRKQRAVLAWADPTKPLIERLNLKTHINGQVIDKLNSVRKSNDVILYSWPFHRQTLTSEGGIEYAISKEHSITDISSAGDMSIPENGFVLSVGPEASFPKLKLKDSVTISYVTDHPKWSTYPNIMDGTPVLIKDGRRIDDYSSEQVIESFVTKQHPRSAVGIKKNGDWVFVAVEGRSETAPGMTLKELTDLMLSIGCINALNLDGGGSVSLFYDGALKNTPSEKDYKGRVIERPVANCILVFPKK